MIKVVLGGPLNSAAGNPGTIELEAKSVRELIAHLGEEYPRLKPMLDKGVSVAIDGQLHRRAGHLKLAPGSEVHVLVPFAGG